MEKDRYKLSEPTVNKGTFEAGEFGCVEAENLSTKNDKLYAYRRLLPHIERTDERYAAEIAVRIASKELKGTYYKVEVECVTLIDHELVADYPIPCNVSLDGIVLNRDTWSTEIEQGYFLVLESLSEFEKQEVAVRNKLPEQLGKAGLKAAYATPDYR